MNELLEKAKRDYPIGTKFRGIFTLIEHICDGYYEILNKDVYVKEYGSNMVRCIYRSRFNKWAEIIKEESCIYVGDFNCPANYCDENGCTERKRYLCEPYEIINTKTMTQQEFNSLRVGDFISNYEVLHKYKEFLIVRCDDGHDLFDLNKINKLGLKVTPKTFMGLEIKEYNYVPCEINGNFLVYLYSVKEDGIVYSNNKTSIVHSVTPTSIRIL